MNGTRITAAIVVTFGMSLFPSTAAQAAPVPAHAGAAVAQAHDPSEWIGPYYTKDECIKGRRLMMKTGELRNPGPCKLLFNIKNNWYFKMSE